MRKPFSTYEKNFIRKNLAKKTYHQMAAELNRTWQSIKSFVINEKLNETDDFLVLHHRRDKMTVRELNLIKNTPGTPAEIAKKINRPYNTVWNVKSGRYHA